MTSKEEQELADRYRQWETDRLLLEATVRAHHYQSGAVPVMRQVLLERGVDEKQIKEHETVKSSVALGIQSIQAINGIDRLTDSQLRRDLARGGRFVAYQLCCSFLFVTVKRRSVIHFIPGGGSRLSKAFRYIVISFLFGWWGFPLGPFKTIETIIVNLCGGEDITDEVMRLIDQERSVGSPSGIPWLAPDPIETKSTPQQRHDPDISLTKSAAELADSYPSFLEQFVKLFVMEFNEFSGEAYRGLPEMMAPLMFRIMTADEREMCLANSLPTKNEKMIPEKPVDQSTRQTKGINLFMMEIGAAFKEIIDLLTPKTESRVVKVSPTSPTSLTKELELLLARADALRMEMSKNYSELESTLSYDEEFNKMAELVMNKIRLHYPRFFNQISGQEGKEAEGEAEARLERVARTAFSRIT